MALVKEDKALNENLWADINRLDAMMENEGVIEPGETYQTPTTTFNNLSKWTPYVTTATMALTYETMREAVQAFCRRVGRRQLEFDLDPTDYNIRINVIRTKSSQ